MITKSESFSLVYNPWLIVIMEIDLVLTMREPDRKDAMRLNCEVLSVASTANADQDSYVMRVFKSHLG